MDITRSPSSATVGFIVAATTKATGCLCFLLGVTTGVNARIYLLTQLKSVLDESSYFRVVWSVSGNFAMMSETIVMFVWLGTASSRLLKGVGLIGSNIEKN